MWQPRAVKEEQPMSGVRFALSDDKSLLPRRPQLQSNKLLRLDKEIVCSLGEDVSRIPSAIRSTMRHLSSRHTEVSKWQAQISESVGRVDREITAVEQVKDMAESYLQERQLYGQLMGDCVALNQSLSTTVLTQDHVLIQLKKENGLTDEIRELLQKQICILLDKLSSLKEVRTKLQADFQDKGEAIKLTTKCITHEVDAPSSRLPAGQHKPNLVSYDEWLAHCRDLRLTADNWIKDTSTFRGNLRFTIANLKNAQDLQRRSTGDSLRRRINELSRVHDMMIWERQQIQDEISDQTKSIQKVMGQISNCDSKMHQATHRLDILNQRPRRELCLDLPHISLTLEKRDLSKMAAELHPVLKRSQQEHELTRRRLMILEDKLGKNAHVLGVQRKCYNLHQSFLPALDTIVILTNKPKLRTAVGHPSPHACSQ